MKNALKTKAIISTKTLIVLFVALLIIVAPMIYFAFLVPTSCGFPLGSYNNGPRPIGSDSGSYYCKLGVGPRNFYKRFSNDPPTGQIDDQITYSTIIQNTANSISNGNGTAKDRAQKIMDWLHNNLINKCGTNDDKRGRTAGQIISSGYATGCTDWTLAFVALARAKGISASVTETVSDQWVVESQQAGCLKNPKEGLFFGDLYWSEC